MIKTLIVDDNNLFRCQIKRMLETNSDIEIIGEAVDGQDAVRKARALQPDVVLMDIRLPGMNGIEATTILRRIMPDVKIVMLTIYDIDEYREAAKTCGVSCFILKKSLKTELVPAIKEAFASQSVHTQSNI